MAHGNILDFIVEQGDRSKLRDYQQSQYGNDPQIAGLPTDIFQQILPTLIQKQQEGQALSQFYGGNQQPTQVPADTQSEGSALQALTGSPSSTVTPDTSALQKRASAMAYLPAGLQTSAAQQMMFQGDGNGGSPAAGANLTGDDYLKTLPQSIASQVKAIAEGRQNPPSGFAMKTPYAQQLMGAVATYDPSFDIANPAKRIQTAKSFSPGGKDRQNINAIETAINTLSLLHDTNEKLGDAGDWGPLSGLANTAKNTYLSGEGDTNLARYNKLSKDAADEVTKAIVANGGTGLDRETRFKGFSANQPKDARQSVIQASIDELMQRLNPVADSYNTGMGTTKNGVQLLTPQAQSAYAKVMGMAPELTKATGQQNQNVSTIPSALQQFALPDETTQAAPQGSALQQYGQSSASPTIAPQASAPQEGAATTQQGQDPRSAAKRSAIIKALKARGLHQ